MEQTSSAKISEALELLEEAARQKRAELKTAMCNKYANLRSMFGEGESGLLSSLRTAKDQALQAAGHAREVGVEKVQAIATEVDKRVHQSPWPFIAGSAAAGLLLGFMLGRSRK